MTDETAQPDLKGRTALITGSGRGIGAAIARRLARRGARTILADIDLDEAQAVAADIRSRGSDSRAEHVDIADEASLAALAQTVEEQGSGLDILVNNAAILDATPLVELTRERYSEVQSVNQDGALWASKAMLPLLRGSTCARILNIASIMGMRGSADAIAYSTAKGGVINLTRTLAVDLAGAGILVNCIAPGFVDTRMALAPDGSGHEHETDWFRDIYIKYGRIPLRRAAQPDDIAAAAAFFCGDDCRYVTGQILLVDGGVSATF